MGDAAGWRRGGTGWGAAGGASTQVARGVRGGRGGRGGLPGGGGALGLVGCAACGAGLRMPHIQVGRAAYGGGTTPDTYAACPVGHAPRTSRATCANAPRAPAPARPGSVRSAPRSQPATRCPLPAARIPQPADASRRTLPIR
ncbi:hypothetical protein GCM10010295_26390 [Streptomyces intermedius]